jgi:signal transduction histidine kinase
MGNFFEQVFAILTTSPGNLVYHMVLVFSIVAALQPFVAKGLGDHHLSSRPFTGLVLMLMAQILLFALSALTWQGLADTHVLFPPLDRAINFFCIIIIIWLWSFPKPSRFADAITVLLGALTVVSGGLSMAVWSTEAANANFNASWGDLLWELFSLSFVLIGSGLLIVRRPSGWSFGLGMLLLLGAGYGAQLLGPFSDGDFSGPVRLAQMAAFPLLLALAARLTTAPVDAAAAGRIHPGSGYSQRAAADQTGYGSRHTGIERRRYSADPKTVIALLELAHENSPNRITTTMTRAISQALLADVCYLISAPDSHGQITFVGGYDLIREESLPGAGLDRERIPQLAIAMQKGRPLRLYANTAVSADLQELERVFGFNKLESLLAVPLIAPGGESTGAILLLSPYSGRSWSAEDQMYLASTSGSLVKILAHVRQVSAVQHELEQMRTELDLARSQIEQLQADQENVVARLEDAQLANVAINGASADLPVSNENLPETEHLEKELHQALREIAQLKNALAEANMKLIELEKLTPIGQPLTNEQSQVIASLAQELRQPMSSVAGYTDLLLGESVGILGALQRKFLERINASIERMRNLVDDLVQVASSEHRKLELVPEPVDLKAIIDHALAYTSAQVREKNLALRLDLPDQFPPLYADRDALQQIVIHLLQNAAGATPADGTVRLNVATVQDNGEQFVLLQVTDTGGGIPEEDIPRVFSRLYRADNAMIQGVGDTGVGLSIAKTLVEAHGGRIWVDTRLGETTTFSVLIPLTSEPKKPADQVAAMP